jgi:hypothetical protein
MKDAHESMQEAKFLQVLTHQQVVRDDDLFLHSEKGILQVCILVEYCKAGDLANYLLQWKQSGSGSLPDTTVRSWLCQLAEAMSHIHKTGFLHCDLKPSNVFLRPTSSSDFVLKIGELGLACLKRTAKRTSRVGTPCYLAPEILHSDSEFAYAEPVDMWGVGCIAFEILTLDFLSNRRVLLGTLVRETPIRPRDLPAAYADDVRVAVAGCLAFRADARPTAPGLAACLRGQPEPTEPGPSPEPDLALPDLGALWGTVSSLASGLGGLLGGIGAPAAAPAAPAARFDGRGSMRYSSGAEYCGEWTKGERSGRGVLTYADRKSQYEGQWVRDRKHGYGCLRFSSGAEYTGLFDEDRIHGQGTYTYADGQSHLGEFDRGLKHGFGTHCYLNGDKWDGVWVADEPSGPGIYTVAGAAGRQQAGRSCYFKIQGGERLQTEGVADQVGTPAAAHARPLEPDQAPDQVNTRTNARKRRLALRRSGQGDGEACEEMGVGVWAGGRG